MVIIKKIFDISYLPTYDDASIDPEPSGGTAIVFGERKPCNGKAS
jgi:hypothetical protein